MKELKYLNKVRIIHGFYKNRKGRVIESGSLDTYSRRSYLVELSGENKHTAWLKENMLEPVARYEIELKPDEPRYAVGDFVVLLEELWDDKGRVGTVRRVDAQGRYEVVIVNGSRTWFHSCPEKHLARVTFENQEELDKLLA